MQTPRHSTNASHSAEFRGSRPLAVRLIVDLRASLGTRAVDVARVGQREQRREIAHAARFHSVEVAGEARGLFRAGERRHVLRQLRGKVVVGERRSEEYTSELQSHSFISY